MKKILTTAFLLTLSTHALAGVPYGLRGELDQAKSDWAKEAPGRDPACVRDVERVLKSGERHLSAWEKGEQDNKDGENLRWAQGAVSVVRNSITRHTCDTSLQSAKRDDAFLRQRQQAHLQTLVTIARSELLRKSRHDACYWDIRDAQAPVDGAAALLDLVAATDRGARAPAEENQLTWDRLESAQVLLHSADQMLDTSHCGGGK